MDEKTLSELEIIKTDLELLVSRLDKVVEQLFQKRIEESQKEMWGTEEQEK